jgi:hypothetical protein
VATTSTSPLETFRSLSPAGDWTWGAGRQNYSAGLAAIQIDIQTALQMFLGEAFWDLTFGVDWWNLIGGKDENSIIIQTRTVILGCWGVQQITSMSALLNRTTRNLNLTYAINTIYGRLAGTVAIPTP